MGKSGIKEVGTLTETFAKATGLAATQIYAQTKSLNEALQAFR